MNKFIHKNFEFFIADFEKTFNQKLCIWIDNNIDIKESRNTRSIEVPKYFPCFSLLSNPDLKFKGWNKLCDRLFLNIKNLNKRSAHRYLADQVHGFLKEVLHKKKLEKKHQNYDFSFNCPEFNRITKKREIYTNPSRRSISRGSDLKFTCESCSYDIHIKSNDVFMNWPQITFRGGKNPEYDEIIKSKGIIHILIDSNRYLSIRNFHSINNHIKSFSKLTGDEAKQWGGPGATRFIFNSSILNLIKEYK